MRTLATRACAINQYNGLGNQLWDLAGSRPSLDLPFADNKSLVDATTGANLVDFTRASSGTYVDSEGVIRTATTNLMLQSEDFSTTWTAQNVTVTADTIASPTGSITADTVADADSGTNQNHRVHNTSISATSGLVHTASFFVKNINSTWVHIRDGFNASSCWFNLSTNTIGENQFTSANIEALSDGWLRLSVTWTPSTTSASVGIGFAPDNGTAVYTTSTGNSFYLWGAQLEQSTTVGEYIPTTSTINSAPRFDHNPTTGESLGLLVEEQRTNSIRNNTMVGAVAGTPGTVPVNWTAGGNAALSREIVGTGIENGISYIDIRFFGTVASVAVPEMAIIFDSNQTTVAAASQAWTASSYLKVVGGSLSNVISGEIFVLGFNSSFVLTEASSTAFNYSTLTGALQTGRVSHTRTLLTGTTVSVNSRVDINFTGGGGVDADITLRIGLPQLEQGAFATSVIPTSGTATTRAADVASISGSNFSSWYRQDEGTVFYDGQVLGTESGNKNLLGLSTGSGNNTIDLFIPSGLSQRFRMVTASVQQVLQNAIPTADVYSPAKVAYAFKLDDTNSAGNGTVQSTDTSCTIPTVDRFTFGLLATGEAQAAARFKRLTYWPARLPNETLQTITQ